MSLYDNIRATLEDFIKEEHQPRGERDLDFYTQVILNEIDRHNAGQGERLHLDEVDVGKIPDPAYIIVSNKMPQENKQALLHKMNDMGIKGVLLPEGLVEVNSREEMMELINRYAEEDEDE